MAITKTDLWNLSLSMLGEDILQLAAGTFDTDTSKAGRVGRQHYDRTLGKLIRIHTWNCCKASYQYEADEVYPALYDTPPIDYVGDVDHVETNFFGWDYWAILPATSIRPLVVKTSPSSGQAQNQIIEWGINGRVLLTNHQDIWLRYLLAPSTDTMDELFINLFTTLLAADTAIQINGKRDVRAELLNEFNLMLPEARRVNAFEGHKYPVDDSDILEAMLTDSSTQYRPFAQQDYGTLP